MLNDDMQMLDEWWKLAGTGKKRDLVFIFDRKSEA